jgi:uncharacterized damage-inducible protein DinB
MNPVFFRSLFTIVIGISSFTAAYAKTFSAPPNDDSLKAQLIRDWERAKAYTKEYIDAMPEDGMGFKPTPEIRSFAEQMLHLSQGTIGLSSNGSGKTRIYPGKNLEKSDEFKTKAALTKVVMEAYDFAIDGLKGMDPAQFGDVVKMGNFSVSKIGWMMKAFEHQTHHRGQATVYLRLKGVTPPAEKLF